MKFLFKADLQPIPGGLHGDTVDLNEVIQTIIAELQPEAAYMVTSGGKQTALFVMDLDDASQIPWVTEPWFQAFNAKVKYTPVMSPEDLKKAV